MLIQVKHIFFIFFSKEIYVYYIYYLYYRNVECDHIIVFPILSRNKHTYQWLFMIN